MTVKNVVAEDQAHLVPADELLPDEKRLGQAFGPRLFRVGDPDSPLRSVPQQVLAPGQVDLGTTTLPFADAMAEFPLFRITCTGEPHPHYGQVILTYDPGFALTTGRCADVGKITLQSLRGLSGRAPYFSNGSARDLRGVIDYYERRYNIGYTEQEKQDLVNLMSAL